MTDGGSGRSTRGLYYSGADRLENNHKRIWSYLVPGATIAVVGAFNGIYHLFAR